MKYRTIVADPPWRVEGSQADGRPWASKGGRRGPNPRVEQRRAKRRAQK